MTSKRDDKERRGAGARRVIGRAFVGIMLSATALASIMSGVASADPATPGSHEGSAAPVLGAGNPDKIKDRYIVVFEKGATSQSIRSARGEAKGRGASIHFDYSAALKGFAATLTSRALDGLRHNPNVAYIEADQVVAAADTQSPATWGLDRVDQRNLPLSNSYTYNFTGSGVTAYIIDTGIRATHTQFGGRVAGGFTSINDGRGTGDCNGHGTHVAGTVGSATYGVAKSVNLIPVRVLDCNGSGSNAGVIAGVDWVTSNHVNPSVANMSLGGGVSSTLDTAVSNSISSGVTYAIAAGNENTNACNRSPGRVATAVTVGSTTSSDARSSFSNYGTCLDIFAPGSSITSTWNSSDSATNTISGTSMATPHVAGVAALYLQQNPASAPVTVRDALVNSATTGVVTGAGTGSPNRLVYSLLESTPTPPPPPPPSGCTGTVYTGTLTYAGDADVQPNGTYYYSAVSGTHKGCLQGPTNADFDLALYRWSGSYWVRVAVSQGFTSTETISYAGTPGYYYWRVYSYSGTGTYEFTLQKP